VGETGRTGDESAEMGAILAREGHADPKALGERVERHDRDHQEHLAQVLACEVPELELLVRLDPLLGADDKPATPNTTPNLSPLNLLATCRCPSSHECPISRHGCVGATPCP
jgi:hypothetical protein